MNSWLLPNPQEDKLAAKMCHLGMVKITTNVSHGACQIAVMYVSRNYSCDGWSESRGAAALTFLSKVII